MTLAPKAGHKKKDAGNYRTHMDKKVTAFEKIETGSSQSRNKNAMYTVPYLLVSFLSYFLNK